MTKGFIKRAIAVLSILLFFQLPCFSQQSSEQSNPVNFTIQLNNWESALNLLDNIEMQNQDLTNMNETLKLQLNSLKTELKEVRTSYVAKQIQYETLEKSYNNLEQSMKVWRNLSIGFGLTTVTSVIIIVVLIR